MIDAEYSAAAEGDVAWAWLASRNPWGEDQADRYIDLLQAAVEQTLPLSRTWHRPQ